MVKRKNVEARKTCEYTTGKKIYFKNSFSFAPCINLETGQLSVLARKSNSFKLSSHYVHLGSKFDWKGFT